VYLEKSGTGEWPHQAICNDAGWQVDSSDSGNYMRTRRHEQRPRRSRRGLLNEETGRNRLQTRALYDTETEVCRIYLSTEC